MMENEGLEEVDGCEGGISDGRLVRDITLLLTLGLFLLLRTIPFESDQTTQ